MIKIPPFMLPDIVTVKEYVGDTGTGEKEFADSYKIRGRLEWKRIVYKDDQGVQTASEAQLITSNIIPPKSEIRAHDHVFEATENISNKSLTGNVVANVVILKQMDQMEV